MGRDDSTGMGVVVVRGLGERIFLPNAISGVVGT